LKEKAVELVVAAIQHQIRFTVADNVDALCESLASCGVRGVDLAVAPECATNGYDVARLAEDRVEIEAGIARIQEATRAARLYSVVGTPTFTGNAVYNSAVVIAPGGEIIAVHHKVETETAYFARGEGITLFDVKGVTCTVGVCRDMWHPELFRIAAMLGASVIAVPHASVATPQTIQALRPKVPGSLSWTYPTVRAHENNAYVIVADLVGPYRKPGRYGLGYSQIIHPLGVHLAEGILDHQDLLITKIDLDNRCEDFPGQARDTHFLSAWWRPVLEQVRLSRNGHGQRAQATE
jgi:predicted amidohydrolase